MNSTHKRVAAGLATVIASSLLVTTSGNADARSRPQVMPCAAIDDECIDLAPASGPRAGGADGTQPTRVVVRVPDSRRPDATGLAPLACSERTPLAVRCEM